MDTQSIGIFDSGSGGLTVMGACRKLLPNENFVYVSDSRGQWGSLSVSGIITRAHACTKRLIDHGCKAMVVACNTATETAIEELRAAYDIPIIGVEPAIKPAVRAYPDGRILVLCTPATSRQTKFRDLCRDYVGHIIVRPQESLAALIEKNIDDLDALIPEVEQSLCGENADAVVLGCTHYVFLRHLYEKYMGGAERVFDGNDGTAKRLFSVLSERDLLSGATEEGSVIFDNI